MSIRKEMRDISRPARIERCIETTQFHRISCCVCGDEQTDEDVPASQLASALFKKGWRYTESKDGEIEDVMCPGCFKRKGKPYWKNH